MNPANLPRVGLISNFEKDFYGKFSDLEGKNILCIGFSEAEIDELVWKYGPRKITTLTKWAHHIDAKVDKYELVIGDIMEKTSFPEGAFDSVLTLSLLEHLQNVEAAFDEMTRIIRPHGEMIHMFGPAWSCAYGHHIYDTATDPLLNFSLWDMPAHMHLLCSPEEITKFYLDNGYDERAGLSANHWFFETDTINRVFYDDYLEIFSQPRFQMDKMELMYNVLPEDHLVALRKKFPGRRDFSTYGGKYRLIVRK